MSKYDLTTPDIRCHADKDGAEVYEVQTRSGIVRVLAHSREAAEAAAETHRPRREEESVLL